LLTKIIYNASLKFLVLISRSDQPPARMSENR
jgi:hypothetical protein